MPALARQGHKGPSASCCKPLERTGNLQCQRSARPAGQGGSAEMSPMSRHLMRLQAQVLCYCDACQICSTHFVDRASTILTGAAATLAST
jgi:hypothetical protein